MASFKQVKRNKEGDSFIWIVSAANKLTGIIIAPEEGNSIKVIGIDPKRVEVPKGFLGSVEEYIQEFPPAHGIIIRFGEPGATEPKKPTT